MGESVMEITERQAELYSEFRDYEFDKVVMLDEENSKDYKMDYDIAISYIYMGKILPAYKKYKYIVDNKDYPEEVKADAKLFVQKMDKMLKNLNINQPDDFKRKQSTEDPMEMYPETHTLHNIIKSKDEKKRQAYFKEVDRMIQSSNAEERALGFFITAEYFVSIDDFQEAVVNYMGALQNDYNKALYWGYCGQVLTTHLNSDPIQCLYFLDNAENLDPKNPRWKFLKALALFREGKGILEKRLNGGSYFNFEAYCNEAIKYLDSARKLCYFEQVRLIQSIDTYEETITKFKGQFEDVIEKALQ